MSVRLPEQKAALVEHFRKLQAELPLLRFLGCRIVDSEDADVVRITMANDGSTQNATGRPHGGALAALVDHAGGLAAALLAGRGGVTSDLHIRYLASTTDEVIVAEARLLKAGRRLVVTEIRLLDRGGQLLATATVTTIPAVAGEPSDRKPSPD